MKKITLFLFGAALALGSCSSDDSASPITSDAVLVKKVAYHYSDDYEGFINYSYDGNKLVEGIDEAGGKEKYYYTGDLITKVEYLTSGNELEYQDLFAYDTNGRLAEYRELDIMEQYELKYVYTYNSDETVTVTEFSGPINDLGTTGTETKLTITGDEVTKKEQLFFGGTTYNYTYDAKNSPFKNVLGYAAIAAISSGDYELFGKNQNIATIVDVTNSSDYTTNTATYNSNNFPTSVVSVANFPFEGETSLTVQYTY